MNENNNNNIFKSMREVMQPDEQIKEQLYTRVENGEVPKRHSSAAVRAAKFVPALALAAVLTVAVVLVYPLVSRDGGEIVTEHNPAVSPSDPNKPLTDWFGNEYKMNSKNVDMFWDYINRHIQLYSEIVDGLEKGDFTAWDKYNDESGRRSQVYWGEPTIGDMRRQLEYWQGKTPEKMMFYKDWGKYNGKRLVTIVSAAYEDEDGVYHGMLTMAMKVFEVGGYLFAENSAIDILVYDGGDFHKIEDAFESGLLRQKDIAALYNKHFKDCGNSKAPGEWEKDRWVDTDSFEVQEGYREYIHTVAEYKNLHNTQILLKYNVNHFEQLGNLDNLDNDEQILEEVKKIADEVVKFHSKQFKKLTNVEWITISAVCFWSGIEYGSTNPKNKDENYFFISTGNEDIEGLGFLERFSAERQSNGSYFIKGS